MEVTNDGELHDGLMEEGGLIMLMMHGVLCKYWRPLLKENYNGKNAEMIVNGITEGLVWDKLRKEELTDLLYANEFELGIPEPSRCRSEAMTAELMSFESWIKLIKRRSDAIDL